MTAPSTLPPSVVAMLDTAARSALAHAIGRDAAARYDRERTGVIVCGCGATVSPGHRHAADPRTCRRCCVDVADPADPMGMCGPCAEIDARP